MRGLRGIGWLARGIICVALIVTLLIVALWAHDVREDRKHTVVARSELPVFAGNGDSSCEGVKIAVFPPGTTFRAQRIRYWKNCATIDISLPDGQNGHIVFGRGVSVSPPLGRSELRIQKLVAAVD